MGREELASPSPLNWLLPLHCFLWDSLPVLASGFLENDFSVSNLSLTGGISLRRNSDPIILVSYMLIWGQISSPLPPSPTPTLCVGGIEMVSTENPWHPGFKLVYEKGRLLVSILDSLLWKQHNLVLTSTLRDHSFLNLFLVTRQYQI